MEGYSKGYEKWMDEWRTRFSNVYRFIDKNGEVSQFMGMESVLKKFKRKPGSILKHVDKDSWFKSTKKGVVKTYKIVLVTDEMREREDMEKEMYYRRMKIVEFILNYDKILEIFYNYKYMPMRKIVNDLHEIYLEEYKQLRSYHSKIGMFYADECFCGMDRIFLCRPIRKEYCTCSTCENWHGCGREPSIIGYEYYCGNCGRK